MWCPSAPPPSHSSSLCSPCRGASPDPELRDCLASSGRRAACSRQRDVSESVGAEQAADSSGCSGDCCSAVADCVTAAPPRPPRARLQRGGGTPGPLPPETSGDLGCLARPVGPPRAPCMPWATRPGQCLPSEAWWILLEVTADEDLRARPGGTTATPGGLPAPARRAKLQATRLCAQAPGWSRPPVPCGTVTHKTHAFLEASLPYNSVGEAGPHRFWVISLLPTAGLGLSPR